MIRPGLLLLLLLSGVHSFTATTRTWRRQKSLSRPTRTRRTLLAAADSSLSSQLAQLAEMTTLSIDSGDLKVIEKYAATGYITDATTNPLFVSQAGLSGDAVYAKMVDNAVALAVQAGLEDEAATVALAMDQLAVNLGSAIASIVPGYISTEVDPRLSFNVDASLSRARRIIQLYDKVGVPKERVLIKLAATWEGIVAAQELEKQGIRCNLTLIFSTIQAQACAQRGIHLISPFPGRILDWYNAHLKRTDGISPDQDEGVVAVQQMHHYFKSHNFSTICMPASWRPSRGSGSKDFALDEIRQLAGVDRMTIPPALLEELQASTDVLERQLSPETLAPPKDDDDDDAATIMTEAEFRLGLAMDACGNDKLAEGIRAFCGETVKLQAVLTDKVMQQQQQLQE